MLKHSTSEISQAVIDTLLYSDVFDFPLTAREVYRYLSGKLAAYDQVCQALRTDPRIHQKDKFFTLAGREELVSLRQGREQRSQVLLPSAIAYGRRIGTLPFVRMVALTGSLAVRNVSEYEDFDYMLVTQPGRLWTARAFVLLFGRFTRLAGHTICPNVIVGENSLAWSQHDLYSARELCQMVPITGLDVYLRLMRANPWVRDFLPNAYGELAGTALEEKKLPSHKFQRILELPLRGYPGDRLERWEMGRKIRRFSSQDGFGDETVFNGDLCQGNFDHHRRWVQHELEKRSQVFQTDALTGHAIVEIV